MPEWLPIESPVLALVLKIGLIIFITLVVLTIVRLIAKRVETRLQRTVEAGERQERLSTLLQAGVSVTSLIVVTIALMMILNEFEIEIAPILASAGIAGLALSLGSQTFIRDFFGGIVILVENQFTVGDVIKVGEITGTVERISLRATYLRDIEGRRVSIPNGDIRTVSNLSTEWARAIVNLGLPRDADIEQALKSLRLAASDTKADPKAKPFLLEDPQVEGWVDMTETTVQVRLMAKTQPGRQWDVAQSLRKHAMQRLKQVGQEAEIEGEQPDSNRS